MGDDNNLAVERPAGGDQGEGPGAAVEAAAVPKAITMASGPVAAPMSTAGPADGGTAEAGKPPPGESELRALGCAEVAIQTALSARMAGANTQPLVSRAAEEAAREHPEAAPVVAEHLGVANPERDAGGAGGQPGAAQPEDVAKAEPQEGQPPPGREDTGDTPPPPPRGTGPAAGRGGGHAVRVRDIVRGNRDARDVEIERVYYKVADQYAVYRAKLDDVRVHYADAEGLAASQRAKMREVSGPARELNTLLDENPSLRGPYDDRLAEAFNCVMEDDVDGALQVLDAAKKRLLARIDEVRAREEERARQEAAAREADKAREAEARALDVARQAEHQKLLSNRKAHKHYAIGGGVAFCILFGMLFVCSEVLWPMQGDPATWAVVAVHPENVWLPAKAGLLGATFSLLISYRNRALTVDPDWTFNLFMPAVRLFIGTAAGAVLYILLISGLIPGMSFGEVRPGFGDVSWAAVFMLGVLAGFSERLVPDLLERNGTATAIPGK